MEPAKDQPDDSGELLGIQHDAAAAMEPTEDRPDDGSDTRSASRAVRFCCGPRLASMELSSYENIL
jgi:hypothetical protein